MSECTHHWTMTSECPQCLRAEIDRLRAERDALLDIRRQMAEENSHLHARLAEAERERNENEGVIAVWRRRCNEAERDVDTLLSMIRHQRDVLRECLPYLNESMAGKRPGRSADDIRAAVKALTADAALERKP